MVESAFGRKKSEENLEKILGTTEKGGTMLKSINAYFSREGFETYYHTRKKSSKPEAFSMLEMHAGSGTPVIVLVNRLVYDKRTPVEEHASFARKNYSGHFVVVSMMDAETVQFNDSHRLAGRQELSRQQFYSAFQPYFVAVKNQNI
jgi:predicted double-glycine peptidase